MCQGRILQILKKTRKPLRSSELSAKLKINTSTISCNLKKLRKYNEVKFVEIYDPKIKRAVPYYYV
jgi:DNA-binding transcriptional regulator GbsR (MarR family)